MSTKDEDISDARARAAILAAGLTDDPAGAEIVPVAGLTNLVFRVTTPERRFWLRLPGAHSAAYLDRTAEAHNARAAAAAGVTPAIIHADADGTMATAFVDGARPLPDLGPIAQSSLRLDRIMSSAAASRGRALSRDVRCPWLGTSISGAPSAHRQAPPSGWRRSSSTWARRRPPSTRAPCRPLPATAIRCRKTS